MSFLFLLGPSFLFTGDFTIAPTFPYSKKCFFWKINEFMVLYKSWCYEYLSHFIWAIQKETEHFCCYLPKVLSVVVIKSMKPRSEDLNNSAANKCIQFRVRREAMGYGEEKNKKANYLNRTQAFLSCLY